MLRSHRSQYLAQGFEFLSEPDGKFMLPVDERLFAQIMGKAKAWGMSMYEQVRVRARGCNRPFK